MRVKSESEVTQSCPTPSDPMDYSLPGSSVHGIFQARVLECGAIAFSSLHLQVGSLLLVPPDTPVMTVFDIDDQCHLQISFLLIKICDERDLKGERGTLEPLSAPNPGLIPGRPSG